MAMGLTLLPAPLEAVCDMSVHPEMDPFSAEADPIGEMAEVDGEQGHEDGNCCETGCHHCSLPCCSGTAMIPAVVQILDASLTPDGRLAARSTDVIRVDADPLYHPPQG